MEDSRDAVTFAEDFISSNSKCLTRSKSDAAWNDFAGADFVGNRLVQSYTWWREKSESGSVKVRRTLERPEKITPDGDDGYFEQLTKAVFRAGFSWAVIREKWDNFVQSFDKFALARVASYGPDDLERLFEDRGIVRNRRKIVATVENARTMLDLIAEHGSFHAYLRTLDHLD